MTITDEAIESVAGYLYTARTGIRWDEVDQHGLVAGACRAQARAALVGALPAIRKQVAEEIAEAIERARDKDWSVGFGGTAMKEAAQIARSKAKP